MKYFLSMLLFIACVGDTPQPSTKQNPVLNQDFPDPTVILAPDGNYYAYATNAVKNGNWINIQVASSTDLLTWNYIGDALPQKPTWANTTQNYWAPHVLYDESLKQYVLFYCAKSNDTTYGMCIGVAFSSSPTGPFVDKGTPLIKGRGFADIDPMAMVDPQTHKKILYWGSGFEPIRVRELTDDWKNFKDGSEAKNVMLPNKEKNYSKLIEGAWVDYHNGTYYLYYSGDNCCGTGANYAVMVARANNAFGPFTRLRETRADSSSVILKKDSTWNAPGHNSIVHDNNGNTFIAYHAIWNDAAKAGTPQGADKYLKRVMCIQPIVYSNGWPVVVKKY